MQASKFLSAGKNEFIFVVSNNIAMNISLDGSFVLYEIVSLNDGVYHQDHTKADHEIHLLYNAMFAEIVPFSGTKTVRDFIMENVTGVLQDSIAVKDVVGMPKLTKSVADGLGRAGEVATFYLDEEERLNFACFGIRKPILDFFSSQKMTIYNCNPSYLYYATNFSGESQARILDGSRACIFINKEKTCGGIVLSMSVQSFA